MSAARFTPLLRTRVAVQTAPGFQAIRSISATTPCNKSAVDATKDTLKKADRTVSDAAVKGINTGGKSFMMSYP
jgi:CHASE3 domain sensor protein